MPPPDRLPGLKPAPARLTLARGGHVVQQAETAAMVFEETNRLGQLGRLPQPHWLRLAPAITGLAQLPLFEADRLPEDAVGEHDAAVAAPAPVLVYGVPGHELGGGGLLQKDGQVFAAPDVLPAYFGSYLKPGGVALPEMWAGALFAPDADIYEVDVPVAQAIHPNVVYGHFLLEMLPRLHLLSRLRRAGRPFLTALHYQLPDWAKNIVKFYFGPDEIIWYDMKTTRVRAPCFIVPAMMQMNGKFHPEFNVAIDEIKDFVLPHVPASPHRRVWLSRRGHKGLHGIRNEDEVEAVVAALGYHVVQPQTLSFPEQIALVDGAEIVASAYGSATHNAMFARRGTKVFCVNRLNHYQSGIGALRSQPLGYFAPDVGRFRAGQIQGQPESWYDVDCGALRDAILRFEDWGL